MNTEPHQIKRTNRKIEQERDKWDCEDPVPPIPMDLDPHEVGARLCYACQGRGYYFGCPDCNGTGWQSEWEHAKTRLACAPVSTGFTDPEIPF